MILNYKKYITLIKEGLIQTHNIEKYYGSLDIELNSIGVSSKINIISKFLYELEILNSDKITNEKLKQVIDINQNLLGYYPSYIWVKNSFGINGFKFDEKYVDNKYLNIKIRFESKYEDGAFRNNLIVPPISYHLSPIKNKDKILKNGLCPKSFNRKSNHPERVYLFDDLNNLNTLLTSLKSNDVIHTFYTLYEIDMNNDMIIHTDPNYKYGYYTTDNISPYDIKIINDNL